MTLRSNLHEEKRLQSQSREQDFKKNVFPVFLCCDGCLISCRTLAPLQGMCEYYRGDACAEYIGNQSIWVQYRIRHQQTIEKQLSAALTVIRTLNQMSARYIRIRDRKINEAFSTCCTVKTRVGFKSSRLNLRSSCQAHMGFYDLLKKLGQVILSRLQNCL